MRIDPAIASLQGDNTLQRHAQLTLEAARDHWREMVAGEVLAALEDYAQDRPLAACPALKMLFAREETARALIDALIAGQIDALRRHPLGHVPLRHQYSPGLTVLQLAQSGRATLTLLTYEEMVQAPASVCFTGGERHEIVLAGAAQVRKLTLLGEAGGKAEIAAETSVIGTGDLLSTKGFAETRQIARVEGRLVLLRLARTDAEPEDAREYALDNGRLLHRASGCRAESRHELAAALLGRMGRQDAAPLLARMAREGSSHLRWQALRECLALDSGIGFGALDAIARDPDDVLTTPANALRAQLLQAWPQLAGWKGAACPA